MFRNGIVEHLSRPGEKVTSFRLSEVEAGKLRYKATGMQVGRLGFQAWDGQQYSNTAHLR